MPRRLLRLCLLLAGLAAATSAAPAAAQAAPTVCVADRGLDHGTGMVDTVQLFVHGEIQYLSGITELDALAAAVRACTAPVISVSMAATGVDDAWRSAVADAAAAGRVVLVAAGNPSIAAGCGFVTCPTATVPGAVAIGAARFDGTREPGTLSGSLYAVPAGRWGETSGATATVAGIIGAVLEARPGLGAAGALAYVRQRALPRAAGPVVDALRVLVPLQRSTSSRPHAAAKRGKHKRRSTRRGQR